jgi:hypothetical protein
MRAPARLAGIGVAALIGAAGLTMAVAPTGRVLAADSASWWIHSETLTGRPATPSAESRPIRSR